MAASLPDLLRRTAEVRSENKAVVCGPESMTYEELDAATNRLAWRLIDAGVSKGDRVAIWASKSCACVAAMQAVLRVGAAYVPIDPQSPVSRAAAILTDCEVRALVTDRAAMHNSVVCESKRELERVACVLLEAGELELESQRGAPPTPALRTDDLAYILYTSGSTGAPKGVCISHRNALAFIEWAARTLDVRPSDRLSNHAPFHFDLSVFDIYAALMTGASVHLVPEGITYAPRRLASFIEAEAITIWYSVPSALILMMQDGGLLERSCDRLRAIVFAGETFPIKQLRQLRKHFPTARLLNFYGPTETNVCTSYEVDEVEDARTSPVPIGTAASGDTVWVETDDGGRVAPGGEGELVCEGPTVMLGYWGEQAQGDVYRTGDVVRVLDDGNYEYVGRRDAMVKVRGYRIELGEIEAALASHEMVRAAAAVVSGAGLSARIVAFLVAEAQARLSLLQLKRLCAAHLPRQMIIDAVHYVDTLPRTGNGKIDRRALVTRLEVSEAG